MLKQVHSYIAYIVLILIVITVINAFIGWLLRRPFKSTDRLLGLLTLIAVHLQFLIGITWLIYTYRNTDFSAVMKDSALRLIIVEHPLMMLIGAILVTIGWSKYKKKRDSLRKYKAFAIYYGITLLIFLSRIPWSQWFS